ncbi:MAG: hypothetical protein AYK19_16540 [Theionarchaea archaeon DG-70-1]|nr:MAG: hypothetical protein AYK19_16540 [Theionarchaea archaeon DG-70-1]
MLSKTWGVNCYTCNKINLLFLIISRILRLKEYIVNSLLDLYVTLLSAGNILDTICRRYFPAKLRIVAPGIVNGIITLLVSVAFKRYQRECIHEASKDK